MGDPESIPVADDGASFSDDRTYRYRLWRTWDADGPTVAFVMLNPSTADERTLDPTCRRCKGFAETWGYGRMIIGNLFALRATDPDRLAAHDDPVGPDNDAHIRQIAATAETVVAAWGHRGDLHDRGRAVAEMLDCELFALDTTQAGHPVHPLYQPAEMEPAPFAYEG